MQYFRFRDGFWKIVDIEKTIVDREKSGNNFHMVRDNYEWKKISWVISNEGVTQSAERLRVWSRG